MKKLKDYECLKCCIGMDLLVAKTIFGEYFRINTRGYNKEIGGIAEDVVAFIFNSDRPTAKKGPDFKDNGECKSVKARLSTRRLNINQRETLIELGIDPDSRNCKTNIRNSGNPPISDFQPDVDFKDSNLYNKLKKIIFIYHINNIIIDIRIFDIKKFYKILESDYNLMKSGRNSETKILTHKKVTNLIQIKKFLDIFLSKSIINKNFKNVITNQEEYINNLFFEKLYTYKHTHENKSKNKVEKNKKIISKMQIRLEKLIEKENTLKLLITNKEREISEELEQIENKNKKLQTEMEKEYNNLI